MCLILDEQSCFTKSDKFVNKLVSQKYPTNQKSACNANTVEPVI